MVDDQEWVADENDGGGGENVEVAYAPDTIHRSSVHYMR